MISTPHVALRSEQGQFAKARALAQQNDTVLRGRAARTVEGRAIDPGDCRRLLSMLGLDGEAVHRDD